MHLEKANSAGEAGLAGWISSNDVTLFTTVLIVVVALFLHSRLLEEQSARESVTASLDVTTTRLTNVAQDLDTALGRLSSVRTTLDRSQLRISAMQNELAEVAQERSALRDELAASREDIQQLNALLRRLQLKSDQLASANEVLRDDQQASLQERATLTQEKLSVDRDLAELKSLLAAKIQALEDAEAERDRLKARADELDAVVSALRSQLTNQESELMAMATTEKKVQGLETELAASQEETDALLAKLRRAAELFRQLQLDRATLQDRVSQLRQDVDQAQGLYSGSDSPEASISRQLVGLQGPLRRVAILFDASGSMNEEGNTSENRWDEARGIAATWLEYLDVDECVLIVFSSTVQSFPAGGQMAVVRGPEGAANRAALMNRLQQVQPRGWTNTLAALEVAYDYPQLDTILLFSDGAPSNPGSGRFDPRAANDIYRLVRRHPNIPINSIGMGNYFDPDFATFLKTVARLSKGTFRGR